MDKNAWRDPWCDRRQEMRAAVSGADLQWRHQLWGTGARAPPGDATADLQPSAKFQPNPFSIFRGGVSHTNRQTDKQTNRQTDEQRT